MKLIAAACAPLLVLLGGCVIPTHIPLEYDREPSAPYLIVYHEDAPSACRGSWACANLNFPTCIIIVQDGRDPALTAQSIRHERAHCVCRCDYHG